MNVEKIITDSQSKHHRRVQVATECIVGLSRVRNFKDGEVIDPGISTEVLVASVGLFISSWNIGTWSKALEPKLKRDLTQRQILVGTRVAFVLELHKRPYICFNTPFITVIS